MCGIAGIVRWSGAPVVADVRAMCDALAHRGPDDYGVHRSAYAAIGMRRLSIIDVPSGHQPMSNEDASVWVVFNGEIYNYRELRSMLRSRGHRFSTDSDTETLVHLYEEYGPRMTDHLRGMFALAIWDDTRHELFVARDRLGIKPLFYAPLADGFAFASELKALLELPEIERTMHWPSAAHVLTFLTTPPGHSIVDGVLKLGAAERGVLRRGRPLATDRYWDVSFSADVGADRDADWLDRLRATLDEATALHLRSDVPVGAFLSGGVDSSAVVDAMTRQGSATVKTFSVGFLEPAYDERPYARAVAEACGTEHHELVLTPQSLDIVDDLIWYLDEPFGDSSAIPTYLVAQLAAEHVKVVLSGDGGDELFGGYDKYVVEGRERACDRWPGWFKGILGTCGRMVPHGLPGHRYLTHVALAGARRYIDASTLFRARDLCRLATPGARACLLESDPSAEAVAAIEHLPAGSLDALQYCDLQRYLPLDILVKVDRMTMAHSLEARPVLLDHLVVELAAKIPERLRIAGGRTKILFKRALAATLPGVVIDRPKQGFAVPLRQWFRGPWTDFVRDTLLSKASRERGIIEPAYVEHLLRLGRYGRRVDTELWTLVCFEGWCRAFLDRPARPARTAMPTPEVRASVRA